MSGYIETTGPLSESDRRKALLQLETCFGSHPTATGLSHLAGLVIRDANHNRRRPAVIRRIYVASSWRNTFQPEVVAKLRIEGFEVYDFKGPDGFSWSEVDPDWQNWPNDVPKYLAGLNHPCAERGFDRDMNALVACDACVMVMPCGMSASLELGWAVGAKRLTIVYTPGIREPDLMVKMADMVTDQFVHVVDRLRGMAQPESENPVESPLNRSPEDRRAQPVRLDSAS